MPKPNNSIKSLERCKTQILDKMVPEEITVIFENLYTEMIALKSFNADQIYIMQKKSNYCKKLARCDDSKILIKSIYDQIEFLKTEIKSKNAIITMILDIIKAK